MSPGFVLDASVTLAWHFVDEDDAYAIDVANALPRIPALTPSLWLLEVGNTVIIGERRDRKSHVKAEEFFDDLHSLPITIEYEGLKTRQKDCFMLARKTRLTTYDACYLELALRYKLPLATIDKDLAKAAKKCGVEIFKP